MPLIGARSAPDFLHKSSQTLWFIEENHVSVLPCHIRRRPESGGARAVVSEPEGEEEVEVPALWEVVVWMTPRMGDCCWARPRRPGPLPLPPVRNGNRPPTTSVAASASAFASCPHHNLGCLAPRLRRGRVHSSDFEGEEEVEVGVEVRRYGRLLFGGPPVWEVVVEISED